MSVLHQNQSDYAAEEQCSREDLLAHIMLCLTRVLQQRKTSQTNKSLLCRHRYMTISVSNIFNAC